MATYREIVFMINDELKLFSNDSDFTVEHLIFLADKYRALLLERKYKDVRKGEVQESNYQTICLDLKEVPALPGSDCSGSYLRSTKKIPSILNIGTKRAFPVDYFTSEMFTWVSKDRMPYVGYNRWLKDIIYITKGVDDYMYLKSENPQFLYLEKFRLEAIFEDPNEAAKLQCNDDGDAACDILDTEFPLEENLISYLIQMIVQELSGARYMPKDTANDNKDNMAGMMSANALNTRRKTTNDRE